MNELLKAGQLEKAIGMAEDNLQQYPLTAFHQVLNRNLLHLVPPLSNFINDFSTSAAKYYHPGLLRSLFGKKTGHEESLKAIYAEMNDFTINYDRWFIDLFAYSSYEGLDDLDWLADFEYSSQQSLTITGFEDLQAAYQHHMENKNRENEGLQTVADICELLIVLRLQELFHAAFMKNKGNNLLWTKLPVLVTAHDCGLIYNVTGKPE